MKWIDAHWCFALAYVQFRNDFEAQVRTGGGDVFRGDLLGAWIAGGEL